MAKFVFDQVLVAIVCKVSVANFVAISTNESSAIDNGSWILIHAFVV